MISPKRILKAFFERSGATKREYNSKPLVMRYAAVSYLDRAMARWRHVPEYDAARRRPVLAVPAGIAFGPGAILADAAGADCGAVLGRRHGGSVDPHRGRQARRRLGPTVRGRGPTRRR